MTARRIAIGFQSDALCLSGLQKHLAANFRAEPVGFGRFIDGHRGGSEPSSETDVIEKQRSLRRALPAAARVDDHLSQHYSGIECTITVTLELNALSP